MLLDSADAGLDRGRDAFLAARPEAEHAEMMAKVAPALAAIAGRSA